MKLKISGFRSREE